MATRKWKRKAKREKRLEQTDSEYGWKEEINSLRKQLDKVRKENDRLNEENMLLRSQQPFIVEFNGSSHSDDSGEYETPPPISSQLTWEQIIQFVRNDLCPVMANVLSMSIEELQEDDDTFQMDDLRVEMVQDVMERMKSKRTMNSREIKYILDLIARAKQHCEESPRVATSATGTCKVYIGYPFAVPRCTLCINVFIHLLIIRSRLYKAFQ